RPPDPAVVGERWRELWQERLEAIKPFGHEWMAHQRRDDFWRHGSVCEDPDAIRCPVYMVGGWADPYRGAVLRMLAAAPDRVRGLIGPWGHVYPHQGAPGPAIDFIELCRRFFAQHLRGEGDGLDDEPALRAWMDGRWIAEPRWPPEREPLRVVLSTERCEHRAPVSHGSDGQTWLPWGAPSDFAGDQRAEDGRSLTFDAGRLERRLEILGEPVVEVELEPAGQLAVRLCDVAPDGTSTLVTFAVLNLRGEGGRVRVPLTAIAHAFPEGHRIRVALAGCYWPWAWPSPETT